MIPGRRVKTIEIRKVSAGQIVQQKDSVTSEEPLEIRLAWEQNGKVVEKILSITMRTPGDDFELAAGFCLTEGIVRRKTDIVEMTYCRGNDPVPQQYNRVRVRLAPGVVFDLARLERHFYTTSSCGICGKASLEALKVQNAPSIPGDRPVVSASVIHALPDALRKAQPVFEKTGGLHAAGLFDPAGNLVALREDVGRHNAVDKLIGDQLLKGCVPLRDRLMLVSGRSSIEIMQKALMAGIPIVAAVGAPSSLAVELAAEFGMTLLGFVKDRSFNIYSGRERIAD